MKQKSSAIGKGTSAAEVTNVSSRGVWLLFRGTEYFMPYDEYPWFKDANISAILDLRVFHGNHLRWPQLDVDLHTDILNHLDAYPLSYSR